MKKPMSAFFLFLFIFFIAPIIGQSWSTLIRLTWNIDDSIFPSMTVGPGNRIDISWQELPICGKGEIFHKSSLDAGDTWSATHRLTWNSGSSQVPFISSDSINRIHIVWHDDTPGNCEIFYRQTTDDGSTWTALQRLTWNADASIFPTITADQGTNVVIMWEELPLGIYQIFSKYSTDNGVTWSVKKRLTWNSGDSKSPHITADSNNKFHVVWYDDYQGNKEIYYRQSSNGGATWSTIHRLTWKSGASINPWIAADQGNGLHVVWEDEEEIYYKSSTDSGVSWSAPSRLTYNSGASYYPSVAVDSLGMVWVVWQDNTKGNFEIYLKRSTDNGGTWSGLKRLCWTAQPSTNPSIVTDSSNDVHVIWADITPGNYEIFYKNRK